jgi:AcrR family transcriptional regulator
MADEYDKNAVPAPPWRKSRKPRRESPPRQQLSRALIVDTALAILDDEGLDGLSMRRVAQELGTGPASLYAHVANKDELLELLLDRVSSEITVPDPDPARWQDQLADVYREIYRVLNQHADIARVALGTVPTGANTLRVSERVLGILLAGGVPPQIAAWSIDRLFLYVAADSFEGSIHLANQRAAGMSIEEYYGQFIGQLHGFFASLPPAQFPHMTEHVDVLTSGGGDARFEFGLTLLIQGIATFTPPPDADHHAPA